MKVHPSRRRKKRIVWTDIFIYKFKAETHCYLLNLILQSNIDCILLKYKNINIYCRNIYIFNIIFFLKNNFFFSCNQLLDFTIIDRLELPIKKNKRFEFIYVLISTLYNLRFMLRGFISQFENLISISKLFNSIIWLEREVWDMFGIFIINHIDLRRILTDYGFNGNPFRKNFPLSGYIEIRYDDNLKYIVIEFIELLQEFRLFKLDNTWTKNVI